MAGCMAKDAGIQVAEAKGSSSPRVLGGGGRAWLHTLPMPQPTRVVAKSLAPAATADLPHHLQPGPKKHHQKTFSTCSGASSGTMPEDLYFLLWGMRNLRGKTWSEKYLIPSSEKGRFFQQRKPGLAEIFSAFCGHGRIPCTAVKNWNLGLTGSQMELVK